MVGNILDLAELMEARHVKPYRKDYPECFIGKADDNFHNVRNWHLRGPRPPIGSIYNNFVFSFPPGREIYLILNDTRHAFPNWATFVGMGYDIDMVVKCSGRHCGEVNIPTGESLPSLR